MLKRFAQILALTVPMLLVACNNGTTSTTSTGGTTTTTTASYAGTYTGTSTGVNSGPSTMVIAADKSIKGTFTINNRTNDQGVPTVYEATFEGTVSSTGAVNVNSFLEGALVMIFTGQIDANGLMTGKYIEAAHPDDPSKHGTFSLQGPKNGSTTTTTTTTTGKGCTGSYVGSVDQPSQEVRRSSRDTWLSLHGYNPATMTEAEKNAATGGGGVDGGIYMEGSFAFETDANCNVIKGQAILYGSPFDITGTVKADRTFTLSYLGPIVGQINADNSITGQLQHGGGEEYIHGVLRGTFTPNGKI